MTQVNIVHVGKALESLRNSSFDTVSAIGEVIDNSIQANAKDIHITIKKTEQRGKVDLLGIAFSDNGDGMDKKLLHSCMQLGFSDRYNDRNGIGRFGVGMTLGAISQCTRIEVYSKPKGGEWYFTYLDLNEMKDNENAVIPEPISKAIPNEYVKLTSDHGTLIIWNNWDREDAKIEDMKTWIGRTYRKFIGKEIIKDNKIIDNPNIRRIFVDGEEIPSYDPLYVTKTKYSSEKSRLDSNIIVEEEIHKFDTPPNNKRGPNKIIIRLSLTPENWRHERGRGDSPDNKDRRIPSNEGISILRNDREVYYGKAFLNKLNDKASSQRGLFYLDRWWGAEISFNADMDHWFSIKNIKTGAKPLLELRKKLEEAMTPSIMQYRKDVHDFWNKNERKENEKTIGTVTDTNSAEDALKSTIGDKPTNDDDVSKIIVEAGEKREEVIATLKLKMSNRPIVFLKTNKIDSSGPFMDIVTQGDKTLVSLNMNHPFFHKFFDVLNELKNSNNENAYKKIHTLLLLILGSYALSQKKFDLNDTYKTEQFFSLFMHNWTYNLRDSATNIKDEI